MEKSTWAFLGGLALGAVATAMYMQYHSNSSNK